MAKKLLIHDYLSLDLDFDVQHLGQPSHVSKVVEGDLTKIFLFAEKYREKGLFVKDTQRLDAKPIIPSEIYQGEHMSKTVTFDHDTDFLSDVHKEQTESEDEFDPADCPT